MPELIGGLASLESKIAYPDAARRAGVEGRVVIEFVVNEEWGMWSPQGWVGELALGVTMKRSVWCARSGLSQDCSADVLSRFA